MWSAIRECGQMAQAPADLGDGNGPYCHHRPAGDRRRGPNVPGPNYSLTSSSPIRDHSSPGTTKLTIFGVATIAGSMVFMASWK